MKDWSDIPAQKGTIQVVGSLVARARRDDRQAIATMFKQFIPEDETIRAAEFLGVAGLWGFGRLSFACLTERRVASLRVGAFGEVTYQDGYLEYINSGIMYQPSRLMLYILSLILILLSGYGLYVILSAVESAAFIILLSALDFLLTLLLFSFMVRMFYRVVKCGLVLWIREGISVYLFANRRLLVRANGLYRGCTALREARARAIGMKLG
jgi:hypothetical protein